MIAVPDVDPLGAGGDPRGRRDGVGAVGLGRPHRVVAEPFGLQDLRPCRAPSTRPSSSGSAPVACCVSFRDGGAVPAPPSAPRLRGVQRRFRTLARPFRTPARCGARRPFRSPADAGCGDRFESANRARAADDRGDPRGRPRTVAARGARRPPSPGHRRLPLIPREPDPAAAQAHALLLEPDPLGQHPTALPAAADAALRVHHAVPRHAVRAVPHRPAHRARRPRPADERGDLAVGHHLRPAGSVAPAAYTSTSKLIPACRRRSAPTAARRARPGAASSACVPSSWIASAMEHQDTIGVLNGRQPVRDGDRRAARHELGHRLPDQRSDSGSTLDVASSSTRIAGLYTSARAMAKSWRSPCEMFAARSTRRVPRPSGRRPTSAAALAVSSARAERGAAGGAVRRRPPGWPRSCP